MPMRSSILAAANAGGAERLVNSAVATAQAPVDAFWNWFFQADFLGVTLVNLTKFAGFLLAGFVLGRVLRYPITRWLQGVTPKTDHATSHRVGRAVERAVFLLIFSIVLKSGAVDILHLPGWAWEKAHVAVTILMAFAATLLFLQFVEVALFGLRKRWQDSQSQVDEHLINFLRKGIRIFVILIAVLVTADNIGFRVSGAIAGLGVGGAALALAAQGLIANILGTIEIVADRLFRVGDRIHFDAFDGFVEEMGLRSTKIRALTGERIIIPNKKMAEAQVSNHSRNGFVRTTVNVGIVYDSSHDRILEAVRVLESIFKERSDVDFHQIVFKNLGACSLEIEVIFWARYRLFTEYNALIHAINLEIKRRFDAAGLAFAFPTRTIHWAGGAPVNVRLPAAVPARQSPDEGSRKTETKLES